MNNEKNRRFDAHIQHKQRSALPRSGVFTRIIMPFFLAISISGFIIYMIGRPEESILPAIEANIIGVTVALITYKAIETWAQRRAANKHGSYKLSTQSQLNDITTKADIAARSLIIEILGRCETLKKTHKSKANTEHLTSILKATSKLENYLKNALHTIQIHSHDNFVRPPVTVHSFRNSIASTLERSTIYAQWHNMTLHYKISPEIPNKMDIDIQSFKVALHNMLLNTINQTQSNSIELSLEVVNTDGINTYLRMAIATNAPLGKAGISAQRDDISHYITKTMIENAGGFLETSTTHCGRESQKCYNIYIPFTERGSDTPAAQHQNIGQNLLNGNFMHRKVQITSPKIMIVDDHPANIMLLHKFIEDHEHEQIDEASSGQQAIRMYNIHHHQIIFMDCQMPNIDGFAASREIRAIEKRNGLSPTIIIGVTADTSRLARKKSNESGMNELVYKPVSRELLAQCLSKYMDVELDTAQQTQSTLNNDSKSLAVDRVSEIQIIAAPTSPVNLNDQTSEGKDASQMPVNLKRLRACTEGNHEEEEIFFNLFLEQAKETLYVLEQTLKNHNGSDWSQAAHKLKGSSANLGADQLAELCQIAEHHDSTIADEDILKAIRSELNKVDDFMHTILNEDLKNAAQNRSNKHMH